MAGDAMHDLVKYTWQVTPRDYLPHGHRFKVDGHTFYVSDGGIESASTRYVSHQFIEQPLRRYLDAVQLAEYKNYKLRLLSRSGPKGLNVFAEPAVAYDTASVGRIRVTNNDGKLIFDSEEDNLRKNQERAELLFKHRDDPYLQAMQRSYGTACADPKDELVHLYEIREAVKQLFGNERTAREALGISDRDWKDFGRICNHDPMPQGRHRGRNVLALGSSSPSQPADLLLTQVCQIARTMIERYLAYLSANSTS